MKIQISKFLSYVLRHDPGSIGIKLDAEGWVDVRALLAASKKAGKAFSDAELREVVATNDKKRFTLSEDGLRIRAAQGHSVKVSLGLTPSAPPPILYHGTAVRNLDGIFAEGLKPGSRQQVHLSSDPNTAQTVGERHGRATVLVVDTKKMAAEGVLFFQADNGVWLTDHVPPRFLTFADKYCTPSES
jgi:putative RNA 2'-phosphotransferase